MGNSLFGQLTGEDIYADMIMQRTNDARNFLVVEGDGDIVLFDRFLAPDKFVAIPAFGKASAHEALGLAFADNFPGIYSILDRDWLELIPGELQDWRIVHTEHYDLDMCVFFAGTIYEAVAASHCVGGGFRAGRPGCTIDELRETCLDIAFPLGVLRYISERDGLGIKLRKFPLHDVVNADLTVNIDDLISVALSRSKEAACDVSAVFQKLSEEMRAIGDRARYCSGHDVAKALSIIAKRRWAISISGDTVERSARAAVSLDQFQEFTIYANAAQWFSGDASLVWRQAP